MQVCVSFLFYLLVVYSIQITGHAIDQYLPIDHAPIYVRPMSESKLRFAALALIPAVFEDAFALHEVRLVRAGQRTLSTLISTLFKPLEWLAAALAWLLAPVTHPAAAFIALIWPVLVTLTWPVLRRLGRYGEFVLLYPLCWPFKCGPTFVREFPDSLYRYPGEFLGHVARDRQQLRHFLARIHVGGVRARLLLRRGAHTLCGFWQRTAVTRSGLYYTALDIRCDLQHFAWRVRFRLRWARFRAEQRWSRGQLPLLQWRLALLRWRWLL